MKAPWHLYLVGLIAVLFNAIGVYDFVMTMTRGTAYLASAGATPDQLRAYAAMPGWVVVIWCVGVFTAFLGALLLVARRRLAVPVFILSLIAYLLNLLYAHRLAPDPIPMDTPTAVISAVIAGQLILLALYANSLQKRQVLR